MTTLPPANNSGTEDTASPKRRPVPPEAGDDRVQAALRDYLERVDRGEALDREKFIAQRPEIAKELRSYLDAEDQVRKLAPSLSQRSARSTQSFALHGQETIAPQAGVRRPSEGSGLKQQFGRYRVIKALGKGAMGMVYLAEDSQLTRQVALKTPHFEQEPTPELLERFYREARAAANLNHPNICPVHDVGQIDGTHYISMAYIDGHPLSAFIGSKPQSERQILMVVRKLAQALAEAHEHGIVHRDLKPANIMVDRRNEPIIMDFGLARQLQREENVRITQSGMLIGTPAYMSPEQIDGESSKVGPASDQFSLAVILYELLTGQLPFRGSLSAVMAQIITKDPTAPSQLRPDLDLRIEALCFKMLSKDPAKRFASLAVVAEEIAVILRTPGAKQVATTGAKPPSPTPAADANVATSGIRQSVTKKSLAAPAVAASLAAKDLASLEELARKCLARHDYDQVIQIVERIPESKRTAGLEESLAAARGKADEVSFLICDIDEAIRLKDGARVLRKADELLKIKPGHHRALKAKEEFTGYGRGGAARLGPLEPFTRPLNEGGWIPWTALAFGLAVAAVVYAIVVIQLGKTVVVIDIQDPGISVQIADKGNQIEIFTGPGQNKVEVAPVEQDLKISYAGLEARTKRFELKQGQKALVTVSIVNKEMVVRLDHDMLPLIDQSEKAGPGKPIGQPPQAAPASIAALPAKSVTGQPTTTPLTTPAAPTPSAAIAATPDGFVPLFNGRDLAGWKTHPSQPGNWRVEKGLLVGSGAAASHLYSERDNFANFHLRAEVRINERGNSGLVFRSQFGPKWPAEAPRFPHGYEAHIDGGNLPSKTGSLFVMDGGKGSGKAVVPIKETLVPSGDWFTLEVIAQDNHIEIKVNGGKVASRDDSHFAKGHIAVQQIEPQTVIEIRKLELKELPDTALAEVAAPAHHFVQLFNGHDLNGWKTHPSQPGNWRIENGMIVGSGPGQTSHLYTERGDYKDFHLRIEARINAGGNSGVYYRAKFGPKYPAKQPRWLLAYNAKLDEKRLGAFLLDNGATNGPLMVRTQTPEPPAGRWVVLEVTARGNHIVIKTDGVVTAEYTDDKRHFASGYIALQQHTPQTRVEFRKVEIEELDSAETVHARPSTTRGFVPLFNGRDLTGWQTRPDESPDWHVNNGILTGGTPGGTSFLYSERGNYKDFHLRVEARIKDDAATELWFRTPKPADGEPTTPKLGYKIEMREPPETGKHRTGGIWAVGRENGNVTLNGYGRKDRVIQPGVGLPLK